MDYRMQLRLSTLARSRAFSKAIRRVRPKFQPLLEAFETVELKHPIHEAILVGITDDRPPDFFEEVETNDSFFQVMAGCTLRGGDDELAEDVFEILLKAMRLCPFAPPDRESFEVLFKRSRPSVLKA